MPADFLPKRESELVLWSANFDRRINTDAGAPGAPGIYGLNAAQAAAYTIAHNAFASLFQQASDPTARTPSVIEAKRSARKALNREIRALTRIVRFHPGVTIDQRVNLGLAKRNPGGGGARIRPPADAPGLRILGQVGAVLKVKLCDQTSFHRGKPKGVDGATIFIAVGEQPPANLLDWKFGRNASRTAVDVKLPRGVEPGTKVWLTAHWFNHRCERGPLCPPVSTHLQFGLALAA